MPKIINFFPSTGLFLRIYAKSWGNRGQKAKSSQSIFKQTSHRLEKRCWNQHYWFRSTVHCVLPIQMASFLSFRVLLTLRKLCSTSSSQMWFMSHGYTTTLFSHNLLKNSESKWIGNLSAKHEQAASITRNTDFGNTQAGSLLPDLPYTMYTNCTA